MEVYVRTFKTKQISSTSMLLGQIKVILAGSVHPSARVPISISKGRPPGSAVKVVTIPNNATPYILIFKKKIIAMFSFHKFRVSFPLQLTRGTA